MNQPSDACQHPPALDDDALFAALNGVAPPGVEAHLATCPACAARREALARELDALASGLRVATHRVGCPDTDALIAYALGEAAPAQRLRVSAHEATCQRCSAELAWIAAALGEARVAPVPERRAAIREQLMGGLRRVRVALAPLAVTPALRGDSVVRALVGTFPGGRAFVELIRLGDKRGLTSQVLFDAEDEIWVGAFAQIWVGERLTATAILDDLHEFAGDASGSGALAVTITGMDGRQVTFEAAETALA